MKVIVSIDIKIIMSIHIITASLSTTQLAVLGGEGGWGTTQAKACVGGEGYHLLCISFRRIVSTSFSLKSLLRCILRSGSVIGQET